MPDRTKAQGEIIMNRKIAIAFTIAAMGLGAASSGSAEEPISGGSPNAEKMGWRLGVQAFSFFYSSPLLEVLDRLEAAGIRYIEAMPGMVLSNEDRKVRFSHDSPPEVLAQVKAKLEETGVTLVNYGVVPLPNDEAACRKVFEFAKEMGIETIVSEPPDDAMALIDKLCAEYEINVAIHNHPLPGLTWSPEIVLAKCEGRSERIGVCADTAHWLRSGLDVVECLKKCEGRILSFHFGDVDTEAMAAWRQYEDELKKDGKGPKLYEVISKVPNAVFGQGPSDMMAWLTEIKRQDIQALFCIEAFFELDADTAQANIAKCAEYLDAAAQQLGPE